MDPQTEVNRRELRICTGLTIKQIKTWQEADPQLSLIGLALKFGWDKMKVSQVAEANGIPKGLMGTFQKLELTSDLITMEISINNNFPPLLVPLIPSEVAPLIIEHVHNTLSHVGERKMLDVIRSYFFFENLRQKVSEAAGECIPCKRGKGSNGTNKADSQQVTTNYPFELVAIDLAEFKTTKRGNKFLLLSVDHYSKRAAGIPMKNKAGITIANLMEYTLMPTFVAMPKRLLTDNGGEFQCKEFEYLMNKYAIRHETIAPGYPASNGAIERLVGTIKSLLRVSCLDGEGREWDAELPSVLYTYNNTKHRTINMKPSEVFLGVAANIIFPDRPNKDIKREHTAYAVGDRVLKKIDLPTSKMDPKYEPDFAIEQVNSSGLSYVVRRLKPKQGQLTLLKAHHNQLKYQGPEEIKTINNPGEMPPFRDKPSSAVKTLSRLAQQTLRPNLAARGEGHDGSHGSIYRELARQTLRPNLTARGEGHGVSYGSTHGEEPGRLGRTGPRKEHPTNQTKKSITIQPLGHESLLQPLARPTVDENIPRNNTPSAKATTPRTVETIPSNLIATEETTLNGNQSQISSPCPSNVRPRRTRTRPKYLKDYKC